HTDQSLVISDSGAHNIRRITLAGICWTIAGTITGERGFRDGAGYLARFDTPSGIVIDNEQRIFIADRHNHAIRLITPSGMVHTIAGTGHSGAKNGGGHSAMFNGPTSLTLDHTGALYVTDTGNHLIRRIQFITMPVIQRELGDVTTILLKEWAEWQERTADTAKQQEIRVLKLERQLMEQRKEFHDYKKATTDEFVRVRQEQMQMQRQFLSSLQNMQQ
ncbi:MAG: hypothetical protein Q7T57_00570, partial [Dehalococcoidales bacterium]|nr:hypothetical protein [Dehalococcoidales bacterium]